MLPASVDLNSDVGEGYGAWAGGPDGELLTVVTSANVACGFHAGDPAIMRSTCVMATANGVRIGAQVGYPDLAGFGRRFMDMQLHELTDAVTYQIGALQAFARVAGSRVSYVKPHGALYNAIVLHDGQAGAVVEAVRRLDATMPILGLPDSAVASAAAAAGVPFVAEGFADRAYTQAGTLLPRTEPGAVLIDVAAVVAQALRLVDEGVRSICVHSDTPGAATLAGAVAAGLAARGVSLMAFTEP